MARTPHLGGGEAVCGGAQFQRGRDHQVREGLVLHLLDVTVLEEAERLGGKGGEGVSAIGRGG
jgi:hypothetical protein